MKTLAEENKEKWQLVLDYVEKNFERKPDLNALLFIIGIREAGALPKNKYSKEEKAYLMHLGNCKVLSYSGYYRQTGFDENGYPVWENATALPSLTLFEQESLLRQHIIEYFDKEEIIVFPS